MSLRVAASIAIAFTAVALGSTAYADKPKIAVLGLEVESKGGSVDQGSTRLAKELTEGFRYSARSGRSKYAQAANSNRELIDEKLMKGCDAEQPSCMAQIGVEVSADFLLYGRIDKVAAGYQVTIKILDVAKQTESAPWRELIPSSAVRDNPRNWAIKRYGSIIGDEPAPLAQPIKPVSTPESSKPLPDPPKLKESSSGNGWKSAAWASGAVTVVLGASFTVSALELQKVDGGKECTGAKAGSFACKNGETLQTVTYVTGPAAAAAALFTGFAIYKSSRSSKERATQAGRKRRSFEVTPVVSADGAGATVRFDW